MLGRDRAKPRQQIRGDLVAVRVTFDPAGDALHFVEFLGSDADRDAVARRPIAFLFQHARLPGIPYDEVQPVVQADGAE